MFGSYKLFEIIVRSMIWLVIEVLETLISNVIILEKKREGSVLIITTKEEHNKNIPLKAMFYFNCHFSITKQKFCKKNHHYMTAGRRHVQRILSNVCSLEKNAKEYRQGEGQRNDLKVHVC